MVMHISDARFLFAYIDEIYKLYTCVGLGLNVFFEFEVFNWSFGWFLLSYFTTVSIFVCEMSKVAARRHADKSFIQIFPLSDGL